MFTFKTFENLNDFQSGKFKKAYWCWTTNVDILNCDGYGVFFDSVSHVRQFSLNPDNGIICFVKNTAVAECKSLFLFTQINIFSAPKYYKDKRITKDLYKDYRTKKYVSLPLYEFDIECENNNIELRNCTTTPKYKIDNEAGYCTKLSYCDDPTKKTRETCINTCECTDKCTYQNINVYHPF